MIANGFKRRYKKSKYLILKSYKNKMSESIEAMSDCATEEINTYLECLDFKEKHYRIVMIGHSMGGLILRLAANKIK
jgi:predicted alpha/beta hydrolase